MSSESSRKGKGEGNLENCFKKKINQNQKTERNPSFFKDSFSNFCSVLFYSDLLNFNLSSSIHNIVCSLLDKGYFKDTFL